MKNKSLSRKILNNKVVTNPYYFKTPSVSSVTIRMLIMLVLQIILLGITGSKNAIFVIAATTSGAIFASVLNYLCVKKQIYSILVSAVQGMLIGMLLPETYPVITAFFISFFVMLISKYMFVNCITAWINIVAVAVIIAWFIGNRFFPNFLITSDLFNVKNPSFYMIQEGIFPVYSFDSMITTFLNNTIFSWLKVTLPEGYISILCDTHSIIPAFRFNLLTIFASIVLFSDDYYSGLIPGVFILVYAALIRFFFPLMVGGQINQGDVILALTSSGTLFIAMFVLSWFGTHPVTVVGKIVYGCLASLIAFLIVGCGTSPIGMVYTVLICNILNLLIRVIEEKKNEIKIFKLVKEI